MLRVPSPVFRAGLCVLILTMNRASAAADAGTLYALVTPPSSLRSGCFGPCECPVKLDPTYGSFELVPAGVDPLFSHYEIRNYIASFNNGPGAVSITGTGTYRVGGEVALEQELTLDLSIWGQPIQHFDSGLVPVSAPFPQIDISAALHGFACVDSVVAVNARPASTTGVPDASHARVALTAVTPNPFRGGTLISWTLPRAGRFDLVIMDLEGRRVRSLAHGQAWGASPQSATWDGRRDDGGLAPAGIYWVSLHSADGTDRRRIVKLE